MADTGEWFVFTGYRHPDGGVSPAFMLGPMSRADADAEVARFGVRKEYRKGVGYVDVPPPSDSRTFAMAVDKEQSDRLDEAFNAHRQASAELMPRASDVARRAAEILRGDL